MDRRQLNTAVRALLTASRRQSNLAEPGSALFDIHMTAAVILGELAEVVHDLYCATPNGGGTLREHEEHGQ